jgi:hypothetical protein
LKPDVVARQLKCLELRLAGDDFETIAKKLHYADKSGPFHAVQAALKATLAETAGEYRQVLLLRLDRLLRSLDKGIRRGSYRHVLAALKIEERRAKLLGLDAPEKHQLSIMSIADLVAELDKPDRQQ